MQQLQKKIDRLLYDFHVGQSYGAKKWTIRRRRYMVKIINLCRDYFKQGEE